MTGFGAIVVGGGLHGLSAALHLARRGCRPVVLEQDRVAAHASGWSAGGVRSLGRDMAEIPLALHAMELWHGIADLVGDGCGYVASGQVKVAENEAELERLRERAAAMRARGWTHEVLLDRAELHELLPALAEHPVGGLAAPDDGFADPFRTAQAFRRAVEAAGGTVREGARVTEAARRGAAWEVRCADGSVWSAPVLVNAAGAWGARLARSLGDEVPLGFTALMMMLTSPLPPFVGPVIGATGRALSFKQFATGHVMIGGGHRGVADLGTGRTLLDVDRLAFSARTALELFPVLRGADIVRMWAGIEGVTPDELPVIGLSPAQDGLVHAFGFSAHGFALAPAVGAVVAQLALDGATNMPLAAFAANRFAARQPTGSALLQPAG